MRDHDVVARYGGEEFVLLLPLTDADRALIVAERIRSAIAARPWPLRPITTSLGVATTGPDVATSERLLDLADRALYRSKAEGRDRVTHADDLGEDVVAPGAGAAAVSPVG